MKSPHFTFRAFAISIPLMIILFTAMSLKPEPMVLKGGKLKGKIYVDDVPPPKKVKNANTSDADIGPIFYEDFVANNGGLANVFVHITAVKARNFPTPAKKRKVIEMKGYQFSPRVTGLMVNQPLAFKNSDGILHNVHGLPKINKGFNIGMPPGKTKSTQFASPEGPYKVKCDVHPWMNGYVAVMTHPYFAVSDANGNFSIDIEGLAHGTYEIEAWHEKLGKRKGTAKIVADDVVINLKY